MSKYHLSPFNEIDLDNPAEAYDAELVYDGRNIVVDINFDETPIKKEKLALVEKFITNAGKYDEKALSAISKDFKNGDTVKDYIDHHLQELSDEELNTLLKNSDKNLSTKEQMEAILHLHRIGFYPETDDEFAVFDYTIGKDLTDYLLVVKFTQRGKIGYISMES